MTPWRQIGEGIVERIKAIECVSVDCCAFVFLACLDENILSQGTLVLVTPFQEFLTLEDDCDCWWQYGFLVQVFGKIGKSDRKILELGNQDRIDELLEITNKLKAYMCGQEFAEVAGYRRDGESIERGEVIDREMAKTGIFRSEMIVRYSVCEELCEQEAC